MPNEGSPRFNAINRGGSTRLLVLTLLAISLLGLALRLVLAYHTWGTNDAETWASFGQWVNIEGILNRYAKDKYLNHPPIPVYWAVVAFRTTADQKTWYLAHDWWHDPAARPPLFSFVFKIPVILADALVAWLLWRVWRERLGRLRAGTIVAAWGWCPAAILVSAYHCNTDPIYAMLCLLSVWLIADRRRHFLGGIALAAAVNIKLTPVLLVPVLLLSFRRWSDATRFVAGLALGAAPFLPVMYWAGEGFRANALAYKSNPDNWGINYLLMQAQGGPPDDVGDVTAGRLPWAIWYYDHGKTIVLILIGAWSLAARLLRRDLYETAAVALAMFLFFAPGFGVQYAAIPLPLMFAARPRSAAAYGLIAGCFLLIVYWSQWPGHLWPPTSHFKGRFPMPAPLWGLGAWLLLGWFIVEVIARWGGERIGNREIARLPSTPAAEGPTS